eukprot:CAMPEP_0203865418 /NCGR_PEP_ID=MMETSP0359-20131031/15349_1 /ASSEMBLY_ACC=CAM_ASM_000338 /TAXON_ID=268821 /ORGANISM="Scrippsiella Hangoei, Strain SHTV-5" /LENGTH=66 /DNA_ID=CAMNT_0050783341 /DNA_START=46 /DNA_END=243 /DNA_ORIENTATION=-
MPITPLRAPVLNTTEQPRRTPPEAAAAIEAGVQNSETPKENIAQNKGDLGGSAEVTTGLTVKCKLE